MIVTGFRTLSNKPTHFLRVVVCGGDKVIDYTLAIVNFFLPLLSRFVFYASKFIIVFMKIFGTRASIGREMIMGGKLVSNGYCARFDGVLTTLIETFL